MAIIQCENGHYYDDEKYVTCPHCSNHPQEDEATMSFVEEEELAINKLAAMVGGDEKTVGIFQKHMKADPVVGWIVCTEGPECGRDYRIHSGRNFIGRSYKMDISVMDDPSITRENHCSIVFDPKHSEFIFVSGEGTKTYFKDKPLTEPELLNDGDVIGIGDSLFVFIAFCKDERAWL